jgi:hypothetical protein
VGLRACPIFAFPRHRELCLRGIQPITQLGRPIIAIVGNSGAIRQ